MISRWGQFYLQVSKIYLDVWNTSKKKSDGTSDFKNKNQDSNFGIYIINTSGWTTFWIIDTWSIFPSPCKDLSFN